MNRSSVVRSRYRGIRSGIAAFFRKLIDRIADLFQPEEVEVTFEKKGNNITYTYTKVNHKQVA